MTSETRVFTAQETSHRILCATLKSTVKESALAIRKHNETKGKARDGYWLSQKQVMKAKARAQHLVYGFVRGHDLDRMEGPKSKPIYTWDLQKALKDAVAKATTEFAEFDYTNDLLKKHVNG